MENTRGGKRIGAGRKKGFASIKAEEARSYAVKRIMEELDPILTGQIELAKGASYEAQDENGKKAIFTKLPDKQVAAFLLNQVIGRAKETSEIKVDQTFSLIALAAKRDALQQEMIKSGKNPIPPVEMYAEL